MNINCPFLAVGLWRSPRITCSVSEAPFLAPSQIRDEGGQSNRSRLWRMSIKEILEKKGLWGNPPHLNAQLQY